MDPCLKWALKLSVLGSRSNNNVSIVKPQLQIHIGDEIKKNLLHHQDLCKVPVN